MDDIKDRDYTLLIDQSTNLSIINSLRLDDYYGK